MARSCVASGIALILWPGALIARSPLQVVEMSTAPSMWGCEILWARARSSARPRRRSRKATVLLRMLEVAATIRAIVSTEVLLLVALLLMATEVLLILVMLILRSVRSRIGVLTILWGRVVHSEQVSRKLLHNGRIAYPRLL